MPKDGDVKTQLLQELAKILKSGDQTYAAETVRIGDKIIVPEGAHLPDVIRALELQHRHEEQNTHIKVKIPVPPWDGAVALTKAIEQHLGVVLQKEGMHGASQIDVEVELGKTVSVPWGRFELPGMEEAEVITDTAMENGRVIFMCHVICKRRYEPRVRRMLDAVREIATKESLHRGKAFSIVFYNEDGDSIDMPQPKFFEISDEQPIFRAELEAAIDRNIFVPIRHSKVLQEEGASLKRGILFVGDYGVGKTLLASLIAKEAIKYGWTFIYVKDSKELPDALRYAQQYQPVIVFAEDVDRVAVQQRTDEVNELLNELDGVDSKSAMIMTILTSNHPDKINPAMLRPGRVDLPLEVLPPDKEAVIRMIKSFAGDMLADGVDLASVAEMLSGETPARVRETVKRARLESLRRTGRKVKITAEDLLAVAKEVKREATLFKGAQTSTVPHARKLAEGLHGAANAIELAIGDNGTGHDHAAAQ